MNLVFRNNFNEVDLGTKTTPLNLKFLYFFSSWKYVYYITPRTFCTNKYYKKCDNEKYNLYLMLILIILIIFDNEVKYIRYLNVI